MSCAPEPLLTGTTLATAESHGLEDGLDDPLTIGRIPEKPQRIRAFAHPPHHPREEVKRLVRKMKARLPDLTHEQPIRYRHAEAPMGDVLGVPFEHSHAI